MNNIPRIDPRKAEELVETIRQKARSYTPEWNFEPGEPDGGAALAELFARMFGETLDRLNNVPYKHYLEFLNLLEVSASSMNPATGMAVFSLVKGYDRGVPVKKGTQLYFDLTEEQSAGDTRRIIFETERDFTAIPAGITGMYSVDPRRDLIERLDLEQAPACFFNPSPERNLQRHRFSVACRDVFSLASPSEIVLSLENTALGYLNVEYVARLADPVFADWSYFDGSRQVSFDRIFTREGRVHLVKDNSIPLQPQILEGDDPEAEPQRWITCDMRSDGKNDEIVMNRLGAGSSYLHRDKPGIHIKPQQVYANDLSIDPEEGGFCFGKQPMSYDCLYISSDEVFSKRDALVHMELELKTVVRQIGTAQETPQYQFSRRYIVEKSDAPPVTPDSVFISRVVWEYWNGAGWAYLKVEGDLNPFRGQEGSFRKQMSFRCPRDMAKSLQNSVENYWIRARVVEVENPFSIYGNLLLPYVEGISLDFDYMGALQPVEQVRTENNCSRAVYTALEPATFIRLFQPMPEKVHAVYLAFDLPPAGYPINLYFRTEGRNMARQELVFDYFCGDIKGGGTWREVKCNDRTNGLEEDGILSLYTPQDFRKDVLFGREAYWLRIVSRKLRFADTLDSCPVIGKIVPNVVEIVQKQTVTREMFSTRLFEARKEIQLMNRPVLDCEVWVNERSDISTPEMTALRETSPDRVLVQVDGSGHVSEFWVKWTPCESFADSGSAGRHYKLDDNTGKISFGDGRNGKVPSAGAEENIRVDYSFGGGRQGNLPENSLEGLVLGLPYVDRATNLDMTCGGSDQHDIQTLERVGPQRLRHRNRAVTAEDYENLVLEHFPEIRDVKCVANYDRRGQQAFGHVTLVVMPCDIENRRYTLKLCKKIEQYLAGLISCELLAGDRFAVVPAIMLKVSATVSISVEEEDAAAETERLVLDAVTEFLSPVAAGSRPVKIEEIPTASDFYQVLKKIRNVAGIQEVILEGRYYEGNVLKVVPLDSGFRRKYMVAASGEHLVRIV